MSGFSADWLGLREPADIEARSARIIARLARHFRGQRQVSIVDLGCGTGSTLRALAPVLPGQQYWTLIDHDEELLEAAAGVLLQWADVGSRFDNMLQLGKCGRRLTVRLVAANLATGLGREIGPGTRLVTASALLDLCGALWIEQLAAAVAQAGAAFYAPLNFDGVIRWRPDDGLDRAVTASFCRHQRRDKGLGIAQGAGAIRQCTRAFAVRGYDVARTPSPWIIADGRLALELNRGIAGAAAESGMRGSEFERWCRARYGRASKRPVTTIGHQDVLALPRDVTPPSD